MNRIYCKILTIAALTIGTTAAVAQTTDWENDPKWGKTIEARTENASLFSWLSDATRSGDYAEAAMYMRTLIDSVPQATPRIYTYGTVIYRNRAKAADTPEAKKMMTDSLMSVYNHWIKNFGDAPERGKAYISNMRLKDYMAIMPEDVAGINKYFDEMVSVSGTELDPNVLSNYFKAFCDGYDNDAVEQDALMEAYDKAMKAIESAPVTTEMQQAREYVEGMFVQTGAANCENIEAMFKDKIAAEPANEELLQKAIAMLQRAKCHGDFFLSTAEKLYAVKKSADIAQTLAVLYNERGDEAKCMQYMNEAVEAAADDADKARMCCTAALMMVSKEKGREAYNFARQAVSIDPEDGMARLLMAQSAWMMISASCSGFDRQAGSWVVYDMLSEARSRFADDPDRQKEIDEQMNSHRGNFPTKEETFMRNLSDGSSYSFNCGGIARTTTVRPRLN